MDLNETLRTRLHPGDETRLEVDNNERIYHFRFKSMQEKAVWAEAFHRAKRMSVTKNVLKKVDSDDKHPIEQLNLRCSTLKNELNDTKARLRNAQKKLINIAGKVKDVTYREEIKSLTLRLVELLDEYDCQITEHLNQTQKLLDIEDHNKKKLEQTIREMALKQLKEKKEYRRIIESSNPAKEELILTKFDSDNMSTKDLFLRQEAPIDNISDDEAYSETFYDVESDDYMEVDKVEKKESIVFEEVVKFRARTVLPAETSDAKRKLWLILKNFIGRDLSRIALPVVFNEPLSFLQRLAEDFQHYSLLKTASQSANSIDRLLYTTLFTISPYASAVSRIYKPFNPLLYETYELKHNGYKFIAEQVGHHPPVSAYYMESNDVVSWGSVAVNTRFSGTSLDIDANGTSHIYYPSSKDHFTFMRAKCSVKNILAGRLALEVFGVVTVVNHVTGDFAVIEYLNRGWWSSNYHAFRGLIFDSHGKAKYKLTGCFDKEIAVEDVLESNNTPVFNTPSPVKNVHINSEHITTPQTASCANLTNVMVYPNIIGNINWNDYITDTSSKRILWRCSHKPENSGKYYNFDFFTFMLNEIDDKKVYAPTDSRYRPDQRLYEDGDIDKADQVKQDLEDKQRKRALDGDIEHQPLWFVRGRSSINNEPCWLYNGRYFSKDREQVKIPNIFL